MQGVRTRFLLRTIMGVGASALQILCMVRYISLTSYSSKTLSVTAPDDALIPFIPTRFLSIARAHLAAIIPAVSLLPCTRHRRPL